MVAKVYASPPFQTKTSRHVVTALDSAGSAEYCRERARSQAHEADVVLDTLGLDDAARAQFRAIARYLVDREAVTAVAPSGPLT